MTALEIRHPLADLAEGLKLDHPELGILVGSLHQKASPYDFFRLLTTQLLPHLRQHHSFKKLINRWERQCRDNRRKQEALKSEAIEEVGSAIGQLATRLEDAPKFDTPEVRKALDEAKGYMDGSIPIYMPPYFEKAASSLASSCRLLLRISGQELLEGIVKPTTILEAQQIDGDWQSVEIACIDKCYFCDAITRMAKNRSKWGWESCDEAFVCWSYLRLAERCWKLTEDDFEGESLKHETLEESQRSAELLGLHGFWTELQSIKAHRRGRDAPFFTIEQFSNYLEVIATEILTQAKKVKSGDASLGLTALALALDGEHLLLVTEEGTSKERTRYLLHTFNSASDPRGFIHELLTNPGHDVTPADIGMKSNSCPNLLKRAKLTGALKDLFFKKGQRKGSINLCEARVAMKNQELAVRLNVQQQVEDMNLTVYNEST